jgi:diguanylate cyclase (GGDEF)-like protein/PAS domain S-box-containing protein
MDEAPAYFYLYKDLPGLRFRKDFTYYHGHFRRAALKNHPDTLTLIDSGMARITSAERARLRRKWMGHPVSFTPYARIFAAGLAAALLLAALAGLWVRALRRAVAQRTHQLQQRNAQLNSLVESSPDLIWMKDRGGIFRICNTHGAKALGKPVSAILGHGEGEVRPDTAHRSLMQDREVLDEGTTLVEEITFGTTSVDARTYEAIKAPVRDAEGAIMGVLCMARDITERNAATVALEQASKVFDSMRDGVIVTDTQLRILRVNRAFSRLTGHVQADIAGHDPGIIDVQSDAGSPFLRAWRDAAAGTDWQGEMWLRHREGRLLPAWWSIRGVRDAQGVVTHLVAVFADLQQIREYQSRIHALTHFDLLTGLPNRAIAIDRLGQAIRRARAEHRKVACLLLGLSNLRDVNESLGHATGDALLGFVAERLKQQVEPQHTLAYMRGNKFALMVEDRVQALELTALAERMLKAIAEPMVVGGQNIIARAGIGIVLYPDDGAEPEILARNMDTAMHQAKQQPRPNIRFYSEHLSEDARRALHLDSALRRAIEEDQFELFFQPQWSNATDAASGFEALIRWHSPEDGLVMPDRFLPFAEKSGLIVPIGRWALREACRQAAQWTSQGLPAVPVAVNVSAGQLNAPGYEREVASALADSGLPPERLHLEITEGHLLNRDPHIDRALDRISASGVSLVIDDFGTGYSSLAYLRHLPVRLLKIDKSFVDDIPEDADATRIVAAIISMAHSLRLEVVAEGVERREQAQALRMSGCDHRQGFLDSPPVPATELPEVLRRRG